MLRACCRSFHYSELTKHTPFQQQQQVTQAPTGNWLFVDKLNFTQVVTALICSSIHHNILISPAPSSHHLTGRGKASLAPGNSAIHTITTVDSTAITACIQAATLKAPRGLAWEQFGLNMFFRPLLTYLSALLSSFFGIFQPTPPIGVTLFLHTYNIPCLTHQIDNSAISDPKHIFLFWKHIWSGWPNKKSFHLPFLDSLWYF